MFRDSDQECLTCACCRALVMVLVFWEGCSALCGVVCLMCCCHVLKEESSLLLGAVFVSPVLLLCK